MNVNDLSKQLNEYCIVFKMLYGKQDSYKSDYNEGPCLNFVTN